MNPSTIDIRTLPTLELGQKNKLPAITAIYFVIDSQGIVQYIGSTVNLKSRFHSHHRLLEFKKIPGLKIAWLTISEPSLLREIEDACISWFNPAFNNNCGDIVGININIPYYQHQWLNETARIIRSNNTKPVPPNERVFPQHLISTAIDLLRESDIDWNQVKNIDDLKQQLGIK